MHSPALTDPHVKILFYPSTQLPTSIIIITIIIKHILVWSFCGVRHKLRANMTEKLEWLACASPSPPSPPLLLLCFSV